ncbi:MAG: polyprenyl synthetase family protein [Clostridia bacterium]|nr:polyprenyl synthetase family protein [Clostridia bacterium]
MQILPDEIYVDLECLESELRSQIACDDAIICEAATQLLEGGGKRLRPTLALLTSRLGDYSRERILPLAVGLELLHMATLVHDDIVDGALIRRGQATVRARWGEQVSVYVGDYLFGRSLYLFSKYQDPTIMGILSGISLEMCEGEIKQIASTFNLGESLRSYFRRIRRKTALLISASCKAGAVCTKAPALYCRAVGRYGLYLGMAFQITDDVLDVTAEESQLGKPVGSDLKEGIITLPAILALNNARQSRELEKLLLKRNKDQEEISRCIEIIKDSGAIERTLLIARRYLNKAKAYLMLLPNNQIRQSLITIADFVATRTY